MGYRLLNPEPWTRKRLPPPFSLESVFHPACTRCCNHDVYRVSILFEMTHGDADDIKIIRMRGQHKKTKRSGYGEILER